VVDSGRSIPLSNPEVVAAELHRFFEVDASASHPKQMTWLEWKLRLRLAPPQCGKPRDSRSQQQQGARFRHRASATGDGHTRRKEGGRVCARWSGGIRVKPPGGNSSVAAENPGSDRAGRIREKVAGRLRIRYTRAGSGVERGASRIYRVAWIRVGTDDTRIAAGKHAELTVCRKTREGEGHRSSRIDSGDREDVEITEIRGIIIEREGSDGQTVARGKWRPECLAIIGARGASVVRPVV
jgi:hypothetical protein